MAQITINEISANYGYNVGNASYATVAMSITSQWGRGYFDPAKVGMTDAQMLEETVWTRYPATQAGLDAFASEYRGPASYSKMVKDYSYQQAMTLLTAGYDVLVCRICPGDVAKGELIQRVAKTQGSDEILVNQAVVSFSAKYPGSFGNNIQIVAQKASTFDRTVQGYKRWYWNIITYVVDASGIRTAVENIPVVFNRANATDTIAYYTEVESKFWTIGGVTGTVLETEAALEFGAVDVATDAWEPYTRLGVSYLHAPATVDPSSATSAATNKAANTNVGTDYDENKTFSDATDFAKPILARFQWAKDSATNSQVDFTYANTVSAIAVGSGYDASYAKMLYAREWVITKAVECGAITVTTVGSDEVISLTPTGGVLDILKDKLSYNPNRIFVPWEDQYYDLYQPNCLPDSIKNANTCTMSLSSTHLKIMEVAYTGRCATGFIDVPKDLPRRLVHIEDEANPTYVGYIQLLARILPANTTFDTNATLYQSHSAFFAPWGQFTYAGTGKMAEASPSFLALMIQRAQILNQSIQYEWALPSNRHHSLRIGQMDYTVPKKVLDKWQKLSGVSVNVITPIPDLGTNIWGNSTLFEVPPATYQALANLSTRYLVNAVEDVVYRNGIAITFQYNNNEAYSAFYAGCVPTLDTMKNVGAIEGYRIEMSADIDGLDSVNANTVLGHVWLLVSGVVNDIVVDLVALPAGAGIDLSTLQ
ncbi:MAG: hypothetical protein IJE78_04895 [Bacteroidaceae bacterium]|nr:hypothetical protein [Bacteroidaceae bacterium]